MLGQEDVPPWSIPLDHPAPQLLMRRANNHHICTSALSPLPFPVPLSPLLGPNRRLTIRIRPQPINSRRTTVNTIDRPTHNTLQVHISRYGFITRQRESLIVPLPFARFPDDIVFSDSVGFAHLGRDGPVEDETVDPSTFSIDDLGVSIFPINDQKEGLTSRSLARPSSVSISHGTLFRCRLRSVAIRIAIPSIIHVRSCSNLDISHSPAPSERAN